MVTARARAHLDAIERPSTWTGQVNSKLWRRIRSAILQRSAGRCAACGHFGADGIDHDPVPLSECSVRGISPLDTTNLKPIHHRRPCAECIAAAEAAGHEWSGRCNLVKSNGSMERFRAKLQAATTPVPAQVTRRHGQAMPAGDLGEREW